jgi:hypothetical protein
MFTIILTVLFFTIIADNFQQNISCSEQQNYTDHSQLVNVASFNCTAEISSGSCKETCTCASNPWFNSWEKFIFREKVILTMLVVWLFVAMIISSMIVCGMNINKLFEFFRLTCVIFMMCIPAIFWTMILLS